MTKLNRTQLNMLCTIMNKKKIEEKIQANIKDNGGFTHNLVTINLILDLLTEELTAEGLQKDGEPNSYGVQIDDLISYYSTLSIKVNKER